VKLLVLVGSTHAGGYNDRLAELAVRELPAEVEVSRFDLSTLPFYDEVADAEGRLGASVDAFRAAVADADAILFTSPAYNGTLSAVAKNAIDVASRPRGNAPIVDKPVLIATAVYTKGADERVIDHARLALTIAGAKPLERAFSVTEHFAAFDESGLADKDRERELQGLVADLLSPATV
jgi:Predicted flavoprotein